MGIQFLLCADCRELVSVDSLLIILQLYCFLFFINCEINSEIIVSVDLSDLSDLYSKVSVDLYSKVSADLSNLSDLYSKVSADLYSKI